MFFFDFITNQNLFIDFINISIIKRLIIYNFLLNFLHFICNAIFIHLINFYISLLIRNYYLNSNPINLLKFNYFRLNFMIYFNFNFLDN